MNRTDGQTAAATDLPDHCALAMLGRLAFHSSGKAMVAVDVELTICHTNSAAAELLGATAAPGRSLGDVLMGRGRPCDMDRGHLAGFIRHERLRAMRHAVVAGHDGRSLRVTITVVARQETSGKGLMILVELGAATTNSEHLSEPATEWWHRQVMANLPGLSVLAFDRDMRVRIATGGALRRGGFGGEAMVGRLLRESLPQESLNRLLRPFQAALDGTSSEFSYRSPVDGRQFRIRVQPITDPTGRIVGGVSLAQDSSARLVQLEHLQRLGNVGCGWYDLASGWSVDAPGLHLLDACSTVQALETLDRGVLLDTPAGDDCSFLAVLTANGHHTAQGNLTHPGTGRRRHLFGTGDAVRDARHTLLHAVITITDVTATVVERERAQNMKAAAAQARILLIRRVSDALVTDSRSESESMRRITDIAATAIGDGTVLRILAPDLQTLETGLISHPDASTRQRLDELLRDDAAALDPFSGRYGPVPDNGGVLSTIGTGSSRHLRELTYQSSSIPADVHHFIAAPIRHLGAAGSLMVFRSDPDRPYEAGDDDLVQVLADRLGGAIADHRVRRVLEQQRVEGRAIAAQLAELTIEQHDLLEQLADVEERERTMLAEVIHDDPLQLIVASILRMDLLQTRLPAAQAKELDHLAAILQQAAEELRTLIVALTPPDLTDGLGIALRALAHAIFVGTTTTITLTESSPARIGQSKAIIIYRIFRESLINARKHSHAATITLSVEDHQDFITTRLTDDGVGAASFDAGAGHLGVATMYARANSAGGRLRIESTPGAGTTVTLTLSKDHADRAPTE